MVCWVCWLKGGLGFGLLVLTLTILPLTLTPTLSGGTPGPCKGYSQSSTHGRMAHRQAVTGLWWRA